jgi:signal transduction histidine kinase
MQQEFINVAAHELRTPMQPILGLTDILRSKETDGGLEAEDLDVTIVYRISNTISEYRYR